MDLTQEPTHWQLSVSGDLEYRECSSFRMNIDHILRSDPRPAVVDLSGLDGIDSSGLGLLVGMSHDHAAAGRRLVLVTNGAIESLLCDSRLDGVFSTAPTLEQAVESLTGGPTLAPGPDVYAA